MSEVVRFEEQSFGGELRRIDPQARGLDISVRLANQEDFAFIDALQKKESNGLGFMWEQAIRKRIDEGNMLIAEAVEPRRHEGHEGEGKKNYSDAMDQCSARQETISETNTSENEAESTHGFSESSCASRLRGSTKVPVGYCMGVDRYQKRSELGIVYQMAVLPAFRRMNVAAMLLQAQFDKSAYGTRLYCCWCKQSLEANRFWEAMGFVPLAFRAAGRTTIEKVKKKTGSAAGAVHIFWQKRIRVGDTQTPWWYPYETQGGAMMESRVILPLPPEVDWHEATPIVLPGSERRAAEVLLLEDKLDAVTKQERAVKKGQRKDSHTKTKAGQHATPMGNQKRVVVSYGFGAGSGFGEPAKEPKPDEAALTAAAEERAAELARIKADKDSAKQALKAAQRKSDPELVAYARELRDRWQECVVNQPRMLAGKQRGKYDVSRLIERAQAQEAEVIEVVAEVVSNIAAVKRLDAA